MSSFIISYDLISQKDYKPLRDAIISYGSYAHVLESVWIIKSTENSSSIRNNLIQYIDSDDKLFVARLTGESAWKNLSSNLTEWIKKNI